MERADSSFIWDPKKEKANIDRHGIDFTTAAKVFKDSKRKIFVDSRHSQKEPRYFCIGKVEDKILTVRFTYRNNRVRISGAGEWRKGRKYYEEK